MKRSLLYFSIIFLPVLASAQSNEDITINYLGQEKAEALQAENPDLWELYLFMNENGYYTQDFNAVKDISEYPDILGTPGISSPEVITEELIEEGFDLLAFDVPVLPKHYGYYRVGETGKLFIIYPLEAARILKEKQQ